MLKFYVENQVSPFNFSTPDGETLYAWHIMPLGLYAKHESEILKQPSGFVNDISLTKGFDLLRGDPDARLIINCKSSLSMDIMPRSHANYESSRGTNNFFSEVQ